MRILITGANGQVGHALRTTLAPLGTVVASTRAGDACVDLAELDGLSATLDRLQPQIVVNAAAYTAVDAAEDDAASADRINHSAVAALARWCASRGALLVHYSTDYVFAGDGTAPYREDQPIAPQSVYGASKAAGERAIVASGAAHLILRTAWVYAARGKNFLLTMLRLATERERLRVVDDQIGCPTPASWLAEATAQMLARLVADERQAWSDSRLGVYHLVAAGQVSWCGFARAIIAEAHAMGLLATATPVDAIATGEFPAKAKRPAYSVLSTDKLRRQFGIEPPSWQEGLRRTLAELARR